MLDDFLYSDKLQHPNDVLEEIISYHKLFQFSFVKGSKSISSDLILRKDVLQQTDRHTPSLGEKVVIDRDLDESEKGKVKRLEIDRRDRKESSVAAFKAKLGEKHNDKEIRVDYEEVFGGKPVSFQPPPEEESAKETKTGGKKTLMSQFPIPLAASEVKLFDEGRLHFELTPEEATEFRECFLKDRSADFYLGFEIVNALFTHHRQVKTFRFPLYYVKVHIREAGRRVYLESRENGLSYLNHIALANLIDKYSDSSNNAENIDRFFKTLLAQDISVDRLNDRIRLARHLPIKESIFDRTREVLFGYTDENGKGGILANLKVEGIECDLESVYLYRAPRLLNPIDQALELDLDRINGIAHQSMGRFYGSLLGQFLVPEQQVELGPREEFAPMTWIPGALPKSSRNLIDRLNSHDIVLLEGPPGTGKTHTIMNLLIHSICQRQRVLIVSDQQTAIEALVEKMQDYLVGADKGTAAERRWLDLLFGALKVVGELETGDLSLPDLLDQLTATFTVPELAPGSSPPGVKLERKFAALKEQIQKKTDAITAKLQGQMDQSVEFDRRVPGKTEIDVDKRQLVEFLSLIQGEDLGQHQVVDGFFNNRFRLLEEEMSDCYGFFRLPVRNMEQEIAALKEDKRILTAIIENKVGTVEGYAELTRSSPRHELIRYLEALVVEQTSEDGKLPTRLRRKLRTFFRPPLLRASKMLLGMVNDQIALLQMAERCSDELWSLFRELHDAVRAASTPHMALTLYRNVRAGAGSGAGARGSIQGDLEEIAQLYKVHDQLVRQRFIDSLREIVRNATATKSRSGTSKVTSIMALVDSLKQFDSVSEAGSLFDELTEALYDAFPIWIARKQVIPFLMPCIERSFDLVVIDEATQCRVDDSLPLMFRASKILVVGDDKQTVLQKNSVIDDYLFKDHELDELLRSTQARRFKGGGSNLFALVKSIKQASVMLDEHYRCPSEVIEFSNRFVYDNELKIMQWRLPEHDPAVIVDYSEASLEPSKKPTSGKFKGIETGMIDRFLEFVASQIRKIERATGERVDVESDVALCYFLLKNEPYVRSVKDDFLRKLKRGDDVLDGAGAELQGKERDYIFYLWDVTRYNMGAFKQGDDADKRKGELNVLLSRPKKKAFHFLHRDFQQLDQSRTNITRYLWQAYHRQQDAGKVQAIDPGDNALSDSLLGNLLRFTLGRSDRRALEDLRAGVRDHSIDFREDIVVGDAGRVVDLVAFPNGSSNQFVGMVDLTGFGCDIDAGQNAVDYFFQLRRASPHIDPVFVFPHELIDENGQTFRALMERMEPLSSKRAKVSDGGQPKRVRRGGG